MSEAAIPQKTSAYIWFDAEFTSLELETARLLQVAVIITDSSLRRLTSPGEDINLCIRIEDEEPVSEWVQQNLPDLVGKCRSELAVTIEEADAQIAALLDRVCGTPCLQMAARPVLAGNSVHNDWFLMRRFMPEFTKRLHYRLLDVSGLKINWMDWAELPPFDKESVELIRQYGPDADLAEANAHDALFDIQASIAELAYYRSGLALKA